jgi:hypothetical protein
MGKCFHNDDPGQVAPNCGSHPQVSRRNLLQQQGLHFINKKRNPPADDFHIVSKFHVFTEKVGTNKTGTDIVQSIPFFALEMAVDNEEQQNFRTELEQEEEDDDLADAFASMAAIKTKSTGK